MPITPAAKAHLAKLAAQRAEAETQAKEAPKAAPKKVSAKKKPAKNDEE